MANATYRRPMATLKAFARDLERMGELVAMEHLKLQTKEELCRMHQYAGHTAKRWILQELRRVG